MKLDRIINSLLETDLYKFSMGQAIYHQFSDYKTTWTFKCRNTDVHFTPEMVQEIRKAVLRHRHRIIWGRDLPPDHAAEPASDGDGKPE